MSDIFFGVDRLLSDSTLLDGRRLGMVTNDAARPAAGGRTSREVLLSAGFNLVRLFSPEHGIAAKAADGSAVPGGVCPVTGLPVVSLYGQRLAPRADELADLDAMLFDVPDVGARFYTYLWTLSHVIDACSESDIEVIVLDRPNPLGGDLSLAEGPLLDVECCGSFLGRLDIPVRHSLTIGEFARLWAAERGVADAVTVTPAVGWTRSQLWPETGLPFVPPSPGMPSFESALLYPGTCLFEATNLSIGRGTENAFRVVGAPWIESERLLHALREELCPGLRLRESRFSPTVSRHAGVECSGIRLDVKDPAKVRPVAIGLMLLGTVVRLFPESFRWETYPTAANPSGADHFERLIGRKGIREELEARNAALPESIERWTSAEEWAGRARPYLIYSYRR